MPFEPVLACYYFPNIGQGWPEWELARRAEPYFTGHRQPLVSAWGHEDESRPAALTVNAWNEWAEGSDLDPDTGHGMKYLEAMRDTFAGQGASE